LSNRSPVGMLVGVVVQEVARLLLGLTYDAVAEGEDAGVAGVFASRRLLDGVDDLGTVLGATDDGEHEVGVPGRVVAALGRGARVEHG
jgi:hypothetical protein